MNDPSAYRHLYTYKYSIFMISTKFKLRFRLLYLLVSINIIFFLIIYHRLILITPSTSAYYTSTLTNEQLSSICFIPKFDPWDQTIAKSLRIKPTYRCPTNKQNLINVINNNQLVINQTVNRTYFSNAITHCVYLKIDRNPEEKYFRDWTYTLSEPILILNGSTLPIFDTDFVLTRCYNNRFGYFNREQFCGSNCSNNIQLNETEKKTLLISKNRSLVYEYVHPLIHLKKPPYSSENDPERSPPPPPPSIIMIVVDAVSDLQAQRALPRTLEYLKSLGLYTFQRHSVVGDGTFENIVPMLFGETAANLEIPNTNDSRYEFETNETEIDPKTKKKRSIKKIVHYPGPYDNYSFIIKNFSQLNYTTFFSEEWRESSFYNLKNGFRQSPTDFYLRPYWLSIYESLSYNKYAGNSNPKPCYLDKLLHMLSLDWLKDFLNVHHQTNNYPTFGIMKMNEMSHDYLERLFWIDHDLKNFFEQLIQEHLLDNTILIFCGDHGHRQHRLRLTRIGSFEAKLPFYSMLIPQTFKENFPQAIINLEKNQEMLTSWWDVYETFVHILKMIEDPHSHNNWQATTPGISLFQPIPERNCSTAGIPEKFCPCTRTVPLDITDPLINELVLASIHHINEITLKDHKHLCMVLELKTIIRAEMEELQISSKFRSNFTHSYTVLFEVSPSDGIFESRLLYNEETKTIQLHSEILRINLYGQTSACIRDKYDLRSFCYCISYHKNLKASKSHRRTSLIHSRFRKRIH